MRGDGVTVRTARRRGGAGLAILLGCAIALAGCAPEPDDAADAAASAQAELKERLRERGADSGEQSWSERLPEGGVPKSTELPASFPRDEFPLPADAVIDDAGERAEGSWFVVLRADDVPAANALWDAVIAGGNFTPEGGAPNPDGSRTAHLSGAALQVEALTVPEEDGTVLLSYDIERMG